MQSLQALVGPQILPPEIYVVYAYKQTRPYTI